MPRPSKDPRSKDLARLLRAGMHTAEIADVWKCSQATVNYWVRKNPELIEIRAKNYVSRRKKTRKISTFVIKTYIEDGWTKKRIANEFEVHISTIQRRIKRSEELTTLYNELDRTRKGSSKQQRDAWRVRQVPELARLTYHGLTLQQIAEQTGSTRAKVHHLKRRFPELFKACMEKLITENTTYEVVP